MLSGLRLSLSASGSISGPGSTSTILYLQPHVHDRIELWDGTDWSSTTSVSASYTLNTTTHRSGSVYDVFAYKDSMTSQVTLELNSFDLRTAGFGGENIGIQTFEGTWVKYNDPTRLYIGTVRTSANGTLTDTSSQRFVWNHFNQIDRPVIINEVTQSWLSPLGSTDSWRIAADLAAHSAEIVVGRNASFLYHAQANSTAPTVTSTTRFGALGVGSQPNYSSAQLYGGNPNSTTLFMVQFAEWIGSEVSSYQPIFMQDNATVVGMRFAGSQGTSVARAGLVGYIRG